MPADRRHGHQRLHYRERRPLQSGVRGSHASSSAMSKLEELADRVERLLLRHAELQRTNALLVQQVATLSHERDNLRSRLNAARSRVDALLERLPVAAAPTVQPLVAPADA